MNYVCEQRCEQRDVHTLALGIGIYITHIVFLVLSAYLPAAKRRQQRQMLALLSPLRGYVSCWDMGSVGSRRLTPAAMCCRRFAAIRTVRKADRGLLPR